jgi:L-ascorbate peroxidase
MIAAGLFLSRSAFLAVVSPFFATFHLLSPNTVTVIVDVDSPLIAGKDRIQTSLDLQHWSTTIRNEVTNYLARDPTVAGPLIRLAFHDATTLEQQLDFLTRTQTGGPNGSIQFELQQPENRGLLKPLTIVKDIASAHPGGSLADIVALVGAQAIEDAGGPHIAIRLGRLDSMQADPMLLRRPLKGHSERSLVVGTMPSAGLDPDGLRLYFSRLGLTEPEFVALSGIHGLGRHVSLLNMSRACLRNLTRTCLEEAPTLLPFVTSSVDRFNNDYFFALLKWNSRQIVSGDVAFIPTDVALVVDPGLRKHVIAFTKDEQLFYRTFTRAYQKLVDTTATTKERY